MKTKTIENSFWLMNTLRTILTFLLFVTFWSCQKDDGPAIDPLVVEPEPEVPTIFGKWEDTSGEVSYNFGNFVHINEDNTINILSEDTLGFRREVNDNISVTENQLILSGPKIYTYTLNEDVLTLVDIYDKVYTLNRSTSAPSPTSWIQSLSILSEGDTSWTNRGDIAFNDTQLLHANPGEMKIGLINPVNFDLNGEIATLSPVQSVEVENYDSPDRYIFQSGEGSITFTALREDTNTSVFESIVFTEEYITGLASVDENHLWVSTSSYIGVADNKLHLYKYDGVHEIIETISLNIIPSGLDYQNGFLYINDNYGTMYKCQTSPDFKAVVTYKIPNYHIDGIAFDGTNFWSNAISRSSGNYKLIKIDLSI